MAQKKKEKRKFVTGGTFSAEDYKTMVNASIKESGKPVIVCILLLAFCCIALASIYTWSILIILAVVVIGMPCMLLLRRNRSIRRYRQQLQETYGTDAAECQTWFTDDHVCMENRLTGSTTEFSWDDLKKAYGAGPYLFIETKGRQAVIVFRNALSAKELDALLDLLKRKGIQVRKNCRQ